MFLTIMVPSSLLKSSSTNMCGQFKVSIVIFDPFLTEKFTREEVYWQSVSQACFPRKQPKCLRLFPLNNGRFWKMGEYRHVLPNHFDFSLLPQTRFLNSAPKILFEFRHMLLLSLRYHMSSGFQSAITVDSTTLMFR